MKKMLFITPQGRVKPCTGANNFVGDIREDKAPNNYGVPCSFCNGYVAAKAVCK